MSQLTPSLVRSFNPGTTVFIATGRHTVKAELTGELARDSYYISDMQRFAEFCFREGYDLAGKYAPVVGEPCSCFEDFVCKTHRQERKYYDIALDDELLSRLPANKIKVNGPAREMIGIHFTRSAVRRKPLLSMQDGLYIRGFAKVASGNRK